MDSIPSFKIKKFLAEGGKGVVLDKSIFYLTLNTGLEPKDNWKTYLQAYQTFAPLTTAIDCMTETSMQDFRIECDDDMKKTIVEDMVERTNLRQLIIAIAKNMLIFGNCFVEVVKDGSGIQELKVLPTLTMRVKVKPTGEIEGYQQGDASSGVSFSTEDIVHFAHNRLDSSPYGNSIIKPMVNDINAFITAKINMDAIMQRYSAPMVHVSIGSMEKGIYPTQNDIDSWSSDLENIYANTSWVTGPECSMEVIGANGKAMDTTGMLNILRDQIIMGLQVPRDMLGLPEGSNKGQAGITYDAFQVRMRTLQSEIKRPIELQLFTTELGISNPTIEEADKNQAPKDGQKPKDIQAPDGSQDVDGMEDETALEKQIPKVMFGAVEEEDEQKKIDTILSLKNNKLITMRKAITLLPMEYQEDEAGIRQLEDEKQAEIDMRQQNFGTAPSDKNSPFDPKSKEHSHVHEGLRNLEMPKDHRWVRSALKIERNYASHLTRQLSESVSFIKDNLVTKDKLESFKKEFLEKLDTPNTVKEQVKKIPMNEIDSALNNFYSESRSQGSEYPKEAFRKGFEKAGSDAKVQVIFNVKDYDAIEYFQDKNNDLLLGASAEIKSRLKTQLRLGIEKGETIEQIRERIDIVEETYAGRLETIARTEVQNAVNTGRLHGYQEANVEEVEYLAADNACEECASKDGEIMSVEEAMGMIPIHPNCRCTWAAIIREAASV